jgi:single-strand DNA-binding protein
MSIDMNIAIIGGRITADATSVGDTGAKFDIASNRNYRDRDGERCEVTTYLPVTCWGPLAEIVMSRGKKGTPVVVEGRIEVRKFTGDDGSPRKYVNIVARDVRFANTRPTRTTISETDDQLPKGINPEAKALLAQLLNAQK